MNMLQSSIQYQQDRLDELKLDYHEAVAQIAYMNKEEFLEVSQLYVLAMEEAQRLERMQQLEDEIFNDLNENLEQDEVDDFFSDFFN